MLRSTAINFSTLWIVDIYTKKLVNLDFYSNLGASNMLHAGGTNLTGVGLITLRLNSTNKVTIANSLIIKSFIAKQ